MSTEESSKIAKGIKIDSTLIQAEGNTKSSSFFIRI